jgi:outer membrane lipoprotein SlyB
LLSGVPAPAASATTAAQKKTARAPVKKTPPQQQTVYAQGYQNGYGDGFAQGHGDWSKGVPRDFQRSDAYQRRAQSIPPQFAKSEQYNQGYDLGFELGYADAYYGRARNNAVPGNAAVLAKAAALADAQRAREQADAQRAQEQADAQRAQEQADAQRARDEQEARNTSRDRRVDSGDNPPRVNQGRQRDRDLVPLNVPGDLDMKLRLTSKIDTSTSRVGDNFTAVVVDPSEYEGATVVGHISKLNRSGRVSGKTELAIEFDSITLKDGRQAPFSADLERVYESENVKKVDEEGNVETSSRTKDSQVRGGVGAAAGAILGGIAGGGKGAVLGAIIGGAAGVGTVAIEGNKDLILDSGTEMLVKTARARNR